MTKTAKYVCGLAAVLMATAASPVRAQGRLVDQATDRVTGAVIRVYKTPQGSRVDVVGKDVELRKELMGTTVVTTVKTAGDWLTIRAETNKLTVSGRRSSAFVSRTDQTGASAVSQIVAASEAARRAAVLIGRLGLGEQSPLRPVLMTTRAMFMAAGGDETGTRELVRWIREERVRTVRVGWQERTPTECWREYQKECAAAFDDMGYCLDHVKWWNPFGGLGCEVTYDLRLLGAFTWYLNCVKLLPLIGG